MHTHLEVPHHDESSSTDPARGKTCCVENAVLMLLNDVGIAEQHNHHNCIKRQMQKVKGILWSFSL